MTGTVCNLISERGFGFIRGEDQVRYFFHTTDVVSGDFDLLHLGDQVAFQPTVSQKGHRATDVVVG